MILDKTIQTIETNITAPSKEFQIRADATAFRILSDSLYSNKILAVIRELACNAHDANPTHPFDVHIPTATNGMFTIRDFGPGLSEADMHDLYTTYFSSSKSATNDATGMFGLGSKSPLCYTTSFTVLSRHQGTESTYLIHLDAEGLPQITTIQSALSTKPTGLTISIPVHPKDNREFQETAQNILKQFSPLPTGNLTLEPTAYIIRTPHLGVRPQRDYRGTKVIMGNVEYPINEEALNALPTNHYKHWSRQSIDLFVPIGDLDITPSREALSHTPKTLNRLLKLFEQAAKELTHAYHNLPNASPWEKYVTHNRLYRTIPALLEQIPTSTAHKADIYLTRLLENEGATFLSYHRKYRRAAKFGTMDSTLDASNLLIDNPNHPLVLVVGTRAPTLLRTIQRAPTSRFHTTLFLRTDTVAQMDHIVANYLTGCPNMRRWEDIEPTLPAPLPLPPRARSAPTKELYVAHNLTSNCLEYLTKNQFEDLLATAPVLFSRCGTLYKDAMTKHHADRTDIVLHNELARHFLPTRKTYTTIPVLTPKQARRYVNARPLYIHVQETFAQLPTTQSFLDAVSDAEFATIHALEIKQYSTVNTCATEYLRAHPMNPLHSFVTQYHHYTNALLWAQTAISCSLLPPFDQPLTTPFQKQFAQMELQYPLLTAVKNPEYPEFRNALNSYLLLTHEGI